MQLCPHLGREALIPVEPPDQREPGLGATPDGGPVGLQLLGQHLLPP
jgi:hypothetical protein